MKGICKRNQVMITALALMIGVAGYLHFAKDRIADENLAVTQAGSEQVLTDGVLVESYTADDLKDNLSEEIGILDLSQEDLEAAGLSDIESLDSDVIFSGEDYLTEGIETAESASQIEDSAQDGIPGEAVFTSTTTVSSLSGAKLTKEQTRAKNKEALLEIINNESLSETQKQAAVDTMVAITQIADMETAAEVLLAAKGFEDVVVSITGDTADVIISGEELTSAKCAQIEDIVQRKTGIPAENIVISTN